jgi:uncharacterized FlaG/YvyC family protein
MDVTISTGPISPVATQVGKAVSPDIEAKPQPAVTTVTAPSTPEPVRTAMNHMELDIDGPTGRFIGRIVESQTGAVVAQVPSEALIRLFEKTRELVGKLLDKTA